MDITEQDIALAKDQMIATLINENLGLRAQLSAMHREGRPLDPHPDNGKVEAEVTVPPEA